MVNNVVISDLINLSKNIQVLYVENEEKTRVETLEFLKMFFKNIAVYSDGKEGLEAAQSDEYDLIIADINMPNMNGLEMIREVRKSNQNIAVFIYSGHNYAHYLAQGIDLNINAYLLKPISLDLFIHKLHDVVKQIEKKKKSSIAFRKASEISEIANTSYLVSKLDISGEIISVNELFCKTSGYSQSELVGKRYAGRYLANDNEYIFHNIQFMIQQQKASWHGKIKSRTKSGKMYYLESIISPVQDKNGNVYEYIATHNDITKFIHPKERLIDEIEFMSDPVLMIVQIANYQTLYGYYDDFIVNNIEEGFKHKSLALLSSKLEVEEVFSLGEGCYAFLIETNDVITKEEVEKTFHEFRTWFMGYNLEVNGTEYNIHTIVSYVTEKNKMLKNALYGLKQARKTKSDFLCADEIIDKDMLQMKDEAKKTNIIKSAMRDDDKIISAMQPIFNNKTNKIDTYESLVRLAVEDKIYLPKEFLDIAKRGIYYQKITNSVIKESFEILSKSHVNISINLSILDIENIETRKMIMETLHNYREYTHRIIFEILESESESEQQTSIVRAFIGEVKQYGVQIAIDDFGVGYSNFERVLNYKPDIIKIDGSLIKNLVIDQRSRDAVEAIHVFSKKLGIKTVAEHVSSKTIHDTVLELGIDYSQGFYLGRPEHDLCVKHEIF